MAFSVCRHTSIRTFSEAARSLTFESSQLDLFMNVPLQITFRQMDVSPAVESRIREEVAALEHFFNRINSCRVVVEAPHRHHQRGKGFHINIDLRVPGRELVVNHQPSLHSTLAGTEQIGLEKHLETQPDHKDVYVSIRDAFAAAPATGGLRPRLARRHQASRRGGGCSLIMQIDHRPVVQAGGARFVLLSTATSSHRPREFHSDAAAI